MSDLQPLSSYDGRYRFIVKPTGLIGEAKASSESVQEDTVPSGEIAPVQGEAPQDNQPSNTGGVTASAGSGPAGGVGAAAGLVTRPRLSSALATSDREFAGIDVSVFEQLPPGVELVLFNGQAGYIDQDGRFVALMSLGGRGGSSGSGGSSSNGGSAGSGGGSSNGGTGSDQPGSGTQDQGGPTEGDAESVGGEEPAETEPEAGAISGLGEAPRFTASADALASQPDIGFGPFPAGAGSDLAVALLQRDGVASAMPIGDGTVAVVVESPSVLHGLGLEVIADVPFALAEDDRLKRYQWYLENNGRDLSNVEGSPSQIADADIDADLVKNGNQGMGVTVAVIDTGVDFTHLDLTGRSWTNTGETCGNGLDDDQNGFVDDCAGWDFGSNDNFAYTEDRGPHGTMVAGIIASHPDNLLGIAGIAPKVEIMDLNVAGPGGILLSSVTRAVRYAADEGADVINISLTTEPGLPPYAVAPLRAAIEYAESKGAVTVAAAGNHSLNIDESPVYPASFDSEGLLAVGALTPDDGVASFSNSGASVDLYAPGELILSTIPGDEWEFSSGTSAASAVVAGVVASVVSESPHLSPAGIRDQVVGTSDSIRLADEGESELGERDGPMAAPVPTRVNQPRANGKVVDPERAYVSIGGLREASVEGVSVDIVLHEPEPLSEELYHWEATLLAVGRDGSGYAIVDQPVVVDWNSDTATDAKGVVTLGPAGSSRVHLDFSLPVGVYALAVEAVPDEDAASRLGDPFLTVFSVGSVDEPQPDVAMAAMSDGAVELGEVDGPYEVMAVGSVAGHADYNDYVGLAGSFPGLVDVHFGQEAADLLYYSPTWMVVRVPDAGNDEPVDVVLVNNGNARAVVTDGYVLAAPGADDGAVEADDGAVEAEDGPADDEDETADSSEGDPEAEEEAVPSDTVSTTDSDESTEEQPPYPLESRYSTIGDPREFGNGLAGTKLDGVSGLHRVPACESVPCRLQYQ